MNMYIITILSLAVSMQISAQLPCNQRITKTDKSIHHSKSIQTDTVCNNRVVWSKIEYPDSDPHYLNPEQNNIRTYQFDSIGRIISKTIEYIYKVDEFYNSDNKTQYEFNYFHINKDLSQENNFTEKIESTIFNLLVDELEYFETKVDFYYEYDLDLLKIRKIVYDFNGKPKKIEVKLDNNGIDKNENNMQIQELISSFSSEYDIRVKFIDNNTISIYSAIVPEKPSPRAGYWRKQGINCLVFLDVEQNINEIDQYWMGKTLYEYIDGKLISIKKIKNDKIYSHKIVE